MKRTTANAAIANARGQIERESREPCLAPNEPITQTTTNTTQAINTTVLNDMAGA
jgi:hypothetical protein